MESDLPVLMDTNEEDCQNWSPSGAKEHPNTVVEFVGPFEAEKNRCRRLWGGRDLVKHLFHGELATFLGLRGRSNVNIQQPIISNSSIWSWMSAPNS